MLVSLFLNFDASASVFIGSTVYPFAEISLPKYEASHLEKSHFNGLV